MLKIEINEKFAKEFALKYSKIVFNKLQKSINSGLKLKKSVIILCNKNKKFLIQTFTKEFIIELMIAKLEKLRQIIKSLEYNKDLHNKKSKFYKIIYNAFVDNGYNKIDKYEFIRNLGLKSCPYCNRNYIFTINQNKNIKPEIDHFYPKSLYPYLAVSFYNLIPSCPVCNGFGAKGSKDGFKDNLKNPYEFENDGFKFSFDIESINIINKKIDEDSIKIKLKHKIDSNNDYFQIENLYQQHKDIVIELYQKFKLEYSKDYFLSLQKSLSIYFSKDEVYRLITCGYLDEKDFHKRPLSKFIKDISEELNPKL